MFLAFAFLLIFGDFALTLVGWINTVFELNLF